MKDNKKSCFLCGRGVSDDALEIPTMGFVGPTCASKIAKLKEFLEENGLQGLLDGFAEVDLSDEAQKIKAKDASIQLQKAGIFLGMEKREGVAFVKINRFSKKKLRDGLGLVA